MSYYKVLLARRLKAWSILQTGKLIIFLWLQSVEIVTKVIRVWSTGKRQQF